MITCAYRYCTCTSDSGSSEGPPEDEEVLQLTLRMYVSKFVLLQTDY